MSTSSISIHSNHAVSPLHETQTATFSTPSKPQHKPFGAALVSSAAIQPPQVRITIGESLGEHAQSTLDTLPSKEGILFTPPPTATHMNESLQNYMQGKKTDLLVVRGNIQVNQNFIESLQPEDRPKFVLRAGTGMNNIDKAYLDSVGIKYTNTPDVNTESTAALGFTTMLTLFRGVHKADRAVKNGEWDRTQLTGSTPHGKTLGIVGVGAIGTELARLAKTSFNMKVLGLRPRSVPPGQAPSSKYIDRYADTLKELMPEIHALSVNVPLTKETRKMIGETELNMMPKGSIVINVAREDVIDEQALLNALNDGQISGAGVDVFLEEKEHGISDTLAKHPHVIATPHIGGQTQEACAAMGKAVVDQARKMFLDRIADSQSKQPTTH